MRWPTVFSMADQSTDEGINAQRELVAELKAKLYAAAGGGSHSKRS